MRFQYSPLHGAVFFVALILLATFVQMGVLSIAFEKLGISGRWASFLFLAALLGSSINIPLFSLPTTSTTLAEPDWRLRGLLRFPMQFTGRTIVAVNVGGCIIPLAFSWYLLSHGALSPAQVIAATLLMALFSYLVSIPIPKVGIGMPILVAPVFAALIAFLIAPDERARLAYVCGTLGVLIGADLLRLDDVRRMGRPVASIGGAGTFDGIFITGIVAVLFA
jgi:uncharacterized membrane protein